MYGWPERDAVGKVFHQLLQTANDISVAGIDEVLRRERRWEGELRPMARDGRRLVVDSREVLLVDGIGSPACILVISRDITERKQTEDALRASEDALRKSHSDALARATELQAVMDAMPVAMFISRDPECRHIFGNRSAYKLLRVPSGSNLSKSAPEGEAPAVRLMKDGEEIPSHELPLQTAAASGQAVYDRELDLVFEDGSQANIMGNAVPLLDVDGRPVGAVGIFADITECKRAEERMRHVQKLQSIGLLAGGIAHDFNNLLTVIMGNAYSALTKYHFCEEVRNIIAASERATHLTRQLLAYAGKGQFISETFDITDLVSRCTELLSASVPRRVKLKFALSQEGLFLKADPSQIEQILMNLVINAGEAIPPQTDGHIEIATSPCEVTPDTVLAHAPAFDARPGEFVCLEVSDDGSGMDETTLAQIFDPFFSTKFTGRGLGLAAVQGIVRSYHGLIDVRSSPGAGSRFRVFLPAAGKKPHVGLPASPLGGARWQNRRHGTVLVLDDEEMVRELACAVLRESGYHVLEAKDGRGALEALAAAFSLPSLVLLDLSMPGMEVEELVPILNQNYPSLRIIITSDYPETDVQKLFPPGAAAGFLQKPYTGAALRGKVEEALHSGGAPSAKPPAAA
jgi:PAS domain S-box-containing protein